MATKPTTSEVRKSEVVADVAAPLTTSKITWASVINGLQGAVTAAMVGGVIPPIPGVPLIVQPLIGIALNAAVVWFRRQMAVKARA